MGSGRNWVDSMRTDMGKEPPKGSPESNPVRILQKGARYAFIQHLPVQATGILERIKNVAPKAVAEVFDVPTVEAVLAEFPESNEAAGLSWHCSSKAAIRRRFGGLGHASPASPRSARRRPGS
jgi:hypothetical protein